MQRGLESLAWEVELPRKCLLNAVRKAGLGTHSWPELPQRLWEVCRDARWVPEAQLPGGFPSCQLPQCAPAENPREGKGVPAARRPRLQLHRNLSDRCKPTWVPRRLCGWLRGSHSHLCAPGTQGDPVPMQRGSLGTTTASTGNLLEAQDLSLPSPHPTPSHQNLHLNKTPQRESPSCQSLGSPELGTASWPDK